MICLPTRMGPGLVTGNGQHPLLDLDVKIIIRHNNTVMEMENLHVQCEAHHISLHILVSVSKGGR